MIDEKFFCLDVSRVRMACFGIWQCALWTHTLHSMPKSDSVFFFMLGLVQNVEERLKIIIIVITICMLLISTRIRRVPEEILKH